MKVEVVVKPNARKNAVEVMENNVYRVSVTAPPHEGKANKAVIELLAEHFSIAKSRVHILKGAKGKKKLVEVMGKVTCG